MKKYLKPIGITIAVIMLTITMVSSVVTAFITYVDAVHNGYSRDKTIQTTCNKVYFLAKDVREYMATNQCNCVIVPTKPQD